MTPGPWDSIYRLPRGSMGPDKQERYSTFAIRPRLWRHVGPMGARSLCDRRGRGVCGSLDAIGFPSVDESNIGLGSSILGIIYKITFTYLIIVYFMLHIYHLII